MVPRPKTEMIRLAAPDISEEDIAAVAGVLRSGRLVSGEKVARFEKCVADYAGVEHAVAVSSGTAALHLAVLACGIGPGDEVIVPDFTFPATANAVRLAGAAPVLVDIDLDTFNIDPSRIEPAITERTKAIIPVDLFGRPAEMHAVGEIAERHDLSVIEDAACALGADIGGRKCGSFANLGCISFHPRKVLTTGEGGMALTNDGRLAQRLRGLRNHGMVSQDKPRFAEVGLNYRMTDFQAALGIGQMSRLDQFVARRAELARLYALGLQTRRELILPDQKPGLNPVWQSYVVRLGAGVDRDRLMTKLSAEGVETGIGTYALSLQPAFAGCPIGPNARQAYERSLSLPLHARLSDSDVRRVVEALSGSL